MTTNAVVIGIATHDLRFPTSLSADGSDAMNKDADYSAAYVVIETDALAADGTPLGGYGLTFTIGRGNDIVAEAARQQAQTLVGRPVAELLGDLGGIYRELTGDSQMRWLGPEKGVVHLSLAAVMNALWDMAGRAAGKPVWRLLAEMSPEELVAVADLRYVSDALTREEAVEILRRQEPTRAQRIAHLEQIGYPVYTTSAGWLGYSDEKLRQLAQEAVDDGYGHIKLKVGGNLEEDIRRLRIAREVIGPERKLMIDANQVWDVDQAIDWVQALAEFQPHWIEEPTSPDDVLGHAKIRKAVAPIGVATGEHCQNRVIFKQFLQAEAIDFLQLDTGRLGSINEIITVLLLAAKFNVPVCPHAGGVGLCEMVLHVSIFDYVSVSADLTDRVTEFVDHLHEHFTDPCIVAEQQPGAGTGYVLPKLPGYSTQIYPQTVADYQFPDGDYWAHQHQSARAAVTEA